MQNLKLSISIANLSWRVFHWSKSKRQGGFTLVELMIVIAISSLLVGSGIAAYTAFNERETMRSVGQRLYNDLRFAQGKAASSEKPAVCSQGTFEGHQLRFESETSYVIEALCSGEAVDIGIRRSFTPGVVLLDFAADTVPFYILGKGSQAHSFCLSGLNRFYQIEVSDSGEIVDNGLVEVCP